MGTGRLMVLFALAACLGGCLASKDDLIPVGDRVKVLPNHVILIGVDSKGRLSLDSARKPIVYDLRYDEKDKVYHENDGRDYLAVTKLKNGFYLVGDQEPDGFAYYLIRINADLLLRYSEEHKPYERWFKAAGIESGDPASSDFIVKNEADLKKVGGILVDHINDLSVSTFRIAVR